MDLTTTYLGLNLPHPFLPGASPMAEDLDTVRRLEDAGAAAIVMYSLFEEEITAEQMSMFHHTEVHAEAHAEAAGYFAVPPELTLGPEHYLEQLRRIREAVRLPVIGSLSGATRGGWIDYARLIEQAGASALELNLYHSPLDPMESALAVEDREVEIVRAVCAEVKIPVAVKLSPFYSSLPHLARRFEETGAAGFVLFQRLMHATIDVEELEARPLPTLSDGCELGLRLRWLGILSAQRPKMSFAVSGGVHDGLGVVRALMTGADAIQLVSHLLRHGPARIAQLRQELITWLEAHEYESLAQLRGSMSMDRIPNPAAYARANYMRMLRDNAHIMAEVPRS